MKSVFTLALVLALVSACAQVGPNDKTVQALSQVPDNTPSQVVTEANNVDPSSLSSQLAAAANNPSLTQSQRDQLSNPQTLAVIANLVQLAQGGTLAARNTAATNLLTTTSSGSGFNLQSLLTLLNTIAPIISAADPALAPIIDVVVTILPLVISIFGGSSTTTAG